MLTSSPLMVGKIITRIIESIVKTTDKFLLLRKSAENPSILNSNSPAFLTIEAYIDRIKKYAECPEEVFIASMIYIDRIVKRNPWFLVTSKNAHR